MSGEQVRTFLMEHGVRYETRVHPRAFTIGEIAEAEHVPGEQMAKAVMVHSDDGLVMAVLPGNQVLDLDKAKTALHSTAVRLASEAEFSSHFPDCEVGAEPPFGALYDVPMLVDQTLQSKEITFNAGTHTETLTVALSDYLELTKPQRVDLAAI
ncbi:MAG: YbaK/EbsC family protein [Acidimicrobiia bacterium]